MQQHPALKQELSAILHCKFRFGDSSVTFVAGIPEPCCMSPSTNPSWAEMFQMGTIQMGPIQMCTIQCQL